MYMKHVIIPFLLFALNAGAQQSYLKLLDRLEAQRLSFDEADYELAAQTLTTYMVDSIFPHWYGRPWTFEGHTNRPDQGEVACGYFVSTTLKHAGMNLNRYRLAQLAATVGTKALDPTMHTLRNISPEQLKEHFAKNKKKGLYAVGLSYHAGFLYWDNEELYFIHSNYMGPGAVEREIAVESDALEQSTVYCIGQITHNKALIAKWLKQQEIKIP